MKKRAFVAAAFAVAVLTTVVWSQGPPGPGGPGGMGRPMMSCPAMASMTPQGPMFDQAAKTLQLTHDQSARLKKILAKSGQTQRTLMQRSGDASKTLRTALLAPDYSTKKINDLAAKAEKAEASVVAANISSWTQIRSILSKSQAARLQKTMTMRGPGPGGPPPGFPPPPPGR